MDLDTHIGTIAPLFERKDKYASIAIYQIDEIMIIRFSGACGNSLVKKYAAALDKISAKYDHAPWGYLSISNNFEAATNEAIETLSQSYLRSQSLGCVADAYVIPSPVAREQLRLLRKQFTVRDEFENVIHSDFESAFNYLKQRLAAIRDTEH